MNILGDAYRAAEESGVLRPAFAEIFAKMREKSGQKPSLSL